MNLLGGGDQGLAQGDAAVVGGHLAMGEHVELMLLEQARDFCCEMHVLEYAAG